MSQLQRPPPRRSATSAAGRSSFRPPPGRPRRTRRQAGLHARKGSPAGLAFRVIREALEAEGAPAFPEDEPPFDEEDPIPE